MKKLMVFFGSVCLFSIALIVLENSIYASASEQAYGSNAGIGFYVENDNQKSETDYQEEGTKSADVFSEEPRNNQFPQTGVKRTSIEKTGLYFLVGALIIWFKKIVIKKENNNEIY